MFCLDSFGASSNKPERPEKEGLLVIKLRTIDGLFLEEERKGVELGD